MTKTLLTIGLVVSNVLTTPAFADQKVTPEVLNVIAFMYPVDSKKEKFGNDEILHFYFDGKANNLNCLNNALISTENKNSFIQINTKDSLYKGQCVTFIKALFFYSGKILEEKNSSYASNYYVVDWYNNVLALF